jgi:predicted LPLAT superfamily acyltransferase
VARHIHCFASTILDRVFLLGGQLERFDVAIGGLDKLHAALDRGRGVLLLGSHLGSFEVLRVLARRRPDYVIRVVLDKGHNPSMTQLLDELNPEIAAGVIDAGQDGPSLMLEIQHAVRSGALVALLGDRVHRGEYSIDAPFLGAPARFPITPMQVAAALKVPVVLGFGLYRGGNRYDLVFEPFSDGLDIPRERRRTEIASLIARYAGRLEHHARSAPFNWFNFYDFWDHSDDRDAEAPVARAAHAAGGNGDGGGDRLGFGGHA